jgi:peptide/nickel transport system ATP-binding protein
MPTTLLKVRNLIVTLEAKGASRRLVSDVSFDLKEQQVLGIIGESGSGKTVLSRALVNWINPPLRIAGGSVEFHGRDLLKLSDKQVQKVHGSEIAYIGSNPFSALDQTVPVGNQIVEKLMSVEPDITRSAARERVLQLFDAVNIPSAEQRFDEFPFQYSGGMMQRALIVDALTSNPAFLVADNITQPLDVTVAAQTLRLMRELQRDFGTAIIFISSSLGIVNQIADEVIVLEAGRIVESQTIRRLITTPQHAYTKRLIEKLPAIWRSDADIDNPTQIVDSEVVVDVHGVAKTYHVKNRKSLFGYHEVQAVRGVSFNVRLGENFGIVGESGCGKSTLSRLLSRIEPTDRGQILFKGQDIASLSRRRLLHLRKRFQLLLQDPYNAIPAHFPIGRTIAEPLLIHGGLNAKEVQDRVCDTMNEVGLHTNLYGKMPVGLSTGQLQRVNIARAMVLEPELLILDETLSALDQVEQAKLLDLFELLQTKHGVTYIYITHDLAMVRRVCTRIAVMYLGRVVELADNHTLFFDSGHPYTMALLSAVPVIETRRYSAEKYLLDGEPPDPVDIPPGCSFRTRCPFNYDRCAVEDPSLYVRRAGAFSACHLIEENPQALNT